MPSHRSLALLAALLLLPCSALADGKRDRGARVDVHVDSRHDDRRGGDRIEVLQDEIARTLNALRDELRALDELVDAAGSVGVQREIHRKVARIGELTDVSYELSERLARIAHRARERAMQQPQETIVVVEPPQDVVIVDPGPVACSAGDFAQLVSAVEDEAFADGKMTVIRDAARHRWFTVAQVVGLMNQMSFSDGKVDVGAELYGRTVDRENWYQVYSALTFSTDKDELRRRTGN